MKIAVTGCGGTGKTTLAKALAQAHGLALIEEGMEDLVGAALAIKDGGELAARAYVGEGAAWLKRRGEAQAALPGFVADRFSFDILTMVGSFGRDDDHWFGALLTECIAQARALDLIVMMPLELKIPSRQGIPASSSVNESGLQRNVRIGSRLLNHGLTRGLMDQLLTVPRLYLPARSATLDERLELVAAALTRLKLI
jgi:hypothetical protein